jgi:hypothetical protein
VEIPPDFGQIPLFPAHQLEAAQRGLRLFDALAIGSPVVTILLVIAALLLFRDRWLGALILACGMLVSFTLARILMPEIIDIATSQIPRAGAQDLVVVALAILLDSLAAILGVGALLSLAAAIVAALLVWVKRPPRSRRTTPSSLPTS